MDGRPLLCARALLLMASRAGVMGEAELGLFVKRRPASDPRGDDVAGAWGEAVNRLLKLTERIDENHDKHRVANDIRSRMEHKKHKVVKEE